MSSVTHQGLEETPLKSRWHRGLRATLILLCLASLCVCFVCFYSFSSPDGTYYDPLFGDENGYLIFKAGQYWIQKSGTNQFVCAYSRGATGWRFHNPSTDELFTFKATSLGIKIQEDPSSRYPEPPRFFFRRGLCWFPKLWYWIRYRVL